MSFQAITNFLLNQNNVDLKNNFLDLQTTDFNNSKIIISVVLIFAP